MEEKTQRVSVEEMDELKRAIEYSGLSVRSFCKELARELAAPGHDEDETEIDSMAEKYRGWFKKGRLPESPLFDSMWELLRQKPEFISSNLIKPLYLGGFYECDLERKFKKLSKQISDALDKE